MTTKTAATKAQIETTTKVQPKNILFLTDFSPAATAACPYAAAIATRFGAHLYALHVRTPAVNPMTEPATWAVMEEAAEKETKAQREILLKAFPGVEPQILIEEGSLWLTLEAVVEKYRIDLIVLGTRGRSGVGKFLMGSVAEEIFRKAPCAVLTVGPHSLIGPPREGEFKEILLATDFGKESSAAAMYAVSLAQEFQARLTLLHVIADEKSYELVRPEELVRASTQLLMNMVPPEAEIWCEPRFLVEKGPAAEKILETAKARNASLIVLGVHDPEGFPGAATHLPIATAHKVVVNAQCPVLTLRG